MARDALNAQDEPDGELRSWERETVDWGLVVFLVLAVIALLLPHISISFGGVYWGAGVAVALFVVWGGMMPTTCMSGGLVCSLAAMLILFNTIGIVLAAIIRLVVSLFT
jgi:hypothetical protein